MERLIGGVAWQVARRLLRGGALAPVAFRAAAAARYKASLAALEAKPTDPVANVAVGKFYCLLKGQWSQGIPMLALGNDPTLSELAKAEL